VLRKYSRLSFATIGKVNPGSMATLRYQGAVCAEIPIKFVVDGFPKYELQAQYMKPNNSDALVEVSNQVNTVVVSAGNQDGNQKASKIRPNAISPANGKCSVISLEPDGRKILLRTISNGVEIQADPYQSAFDMVRQAVADIQAEGAKPLALSDCMNFGDPDNPEVAYELQESVRGLADACKEFNIPVVGGNVSLYNETNGNSILNQLFIGMIGIVE
jgi:phosphoribosylformylglycinamidine synthase